MWAKQGTTEHSKVPSFPSTSHAFPPSLVHLHGWGKVGKHQVAGGNQQ